MQQDDRLLPGAGADLLKTAVADPGAELCSALSARRGLPLIGSAGCYDAILAFELDPPWTPRLAGSRASDPQLDSVIGRIGVQARAVRLLALEPGAERHDFVRILWLSKPAGAFAAYSRREYAVARDQLALTLEALALVGIAEADELACAPGQRDILVCTHGARDACCGKFGYPLFCEFVEASTQRAAGSTPLRVWRTSHLGGHRFAPTLIDLPSGRMYGRMAAGDAQAVIDGGAKLRERLPSIYRGRCALPEAAQLVERQLWLQMGEPFEDAVLSWSVESQAGLWHVRLAAECRRHPGVAVDARVERADVDAIATPASCGRDPEAEAPWRIVA